MNYLAFALSRFNSVVPRNEGMLGSLPEYASKGSRQGAKLAKVYLQNSKDTFLSKPSSSVLRSLASFAPWREIGYDCECWQWPHCDLYRKTSPTMKNEKTVVWFRLYVPRGSTPSKCRTKKSARRR